jgi:hypothetical protein
MLSRDSDKSLGKRELRLRLLLRVFVFFWFGQFHCDHINHLPTQPRSSLVAKGRFDLLDAMLMALNTLCQFESTAATAGHEEHVNISSRAATWFLSNPAIVFNSYRIH